MALHAILGHSGDMQSSESELRRLAKVFLSGFQFDSICEAQDAWTIIQAEYEVLAKSLSDADAKGFERLIDQMLDDLLLHQE